MTWILNIETSGDVCSAALGRSGQTIALAERAERNVHAAMLTTLVSEVLQKGGITVKELAAVAVSKGPGSYTGLRVGVSAAKGLCYALNIPLIALNTLEMMAEGFMAQNPSTKGLLCPMLDARRMEVYTALFNTQIEAVATTTAMILDENSFGPHKQQTIHFFGSGAFKMNNFSAAFSKAKVYEGFQPSAAFMSRAAWHALQNSQFEDTAYFEPFYLKDFVGTTPRKQIET